MHYIPFSTKITVNSKRIFFFYVGSNVDTEPTYGDEAEAQPLLFKKK